MLIHSYKLLKSQNINDEKSFNKILGWSHLANKIFLSVNGQ